MCLFNTNLYTFKHWNWEGDKIVHQPIVPSFRTVPVTHKHYKIDIREFLSFKDNAVIGQNLKKIIATLEESQKFLFYSNESGSFDFRAQKILEHLSEHIIYQYPKKGLGKKNNNEPDIWLFPDETLANGKGDCEDLSFLLAALLLSSGISSYVIRVALGKLYNHKTKKSFDHVWVMYKNEAGLWTLFDPVLFVKSKKSEDKNLTKKVKMNPEEKIEYIPYYVLNDEHLWQIDRNAIKTDFNEYLLKRDFWKKFDPKFAGSIHNNIFDDALSSLSWFQMQYIKTISLAIDTIKSYDPKDHFDNGYIKESWEKIQNKIEEKTLNGLAFATHAVADFYAHTTYAHFAKIENDKLALYDISAPDSFERKPEYGSGDLDAHNSTKYSVNTEVFKKSINERINYLNKQKIISGRFAQPGDPSQKFLEQNFVYIPHEMLMEKDFEWKGCLPHHNEIAVDAPLVKGKTPDGHRLYLPVEYQKQYELRRKAAIDHVKIIYSAWDLLRQQP